MRPLRLEIEGFTSFREKAVLDFEGLDLFAVTGPTGAGKSSLVDALVFALYGQVPRVGKEYRQLLSHGAERASVRVDFAVGQDRYRVVRTIRAAGAAPARLERVLPGPPEKTIPLADRVGEIEKAVGRIVGLDYDAFTRSVVLPQGEFDAFLKGEAKERRKILITLLDLNVYIDMHEAANRRAAEARREAEFIGGQLGSDYAGTTPAAKAALETARGEAEATRRAAEARLEALGTVHEAAVRVEEARREAETRAREASDATKARDTAEAAPGEQRKRQAALETERTSLLARIETLAFDPERQAVLLGARPAANRLRDLVPRREQQARAARKLADAARDALPKAQAAREAVPAAEAAAGAARAAVDDARAQREALHRAHAAHELRRALKPGDPCPVCQQTIGRLPKEAAPAHERADRELGAAEKALGAALEGLTHAKVAAERLKAEAARLQGDSAQAQSLLETMDREVDEASATLRSARFTAKDLGDPPSVVRTIEAELRAQTEARTARAEAEALLKRLETDLAGAQAVLAAAEAQVAAARGREAEAGTRAATARTEEQRATKAFQDLIAGGGHREILSDPEAGRRPVRAVESLRAAVQKALNGHTAEAARLAAEGAEMERRLAKAAELLERKKARDTEAALASALAQSLRADQFLAYVLEEALGLLAHDGSRHLEQLSQGRYSLVCEGQEFFVVDHWNADARRSVKTLSGGETFLASLGLALALAESLASLSAEDRAGEALQSLFLDEGFGTLDPETLGQVVEAVEALQGGERMVGVITHIPELAEQLPARVVVGRSPRGATLAIA